MNKPLTTEIIVNRIQAIVNLERIKQAKRYRAMTAKKIRTENAQRIGVLYLLKKFFISFSFKAKHLKAHE